MVIESKYTSPPPATVAQTLAAKPARMPSDTGTSIPSRRARKSAMAEEKNGPQANTITGTVSTRLAQRITCPASALRVPRSSMYRGTAYIITCMAPKPATNSLHNAARCSFPSRRRCFSASKG